MRVLIVDDEALARLRLRSLLQDMADPRVQAVAEAADADEALRLVRAAPADLPWDLLLLDIRMPGPSRHMGLRLAAALRSLPQPPAVVFVTAHAEHALTAFDLEAVDYLTKPVRRERLQAALQRVQQRLQERLAARAGAPALPDLHSAALAAAALAPALVVSERGRVLRIPLPEVLYLKAEQKYVTLRTAQHSYLLDEPLAELEARLAALGGPPFMRVHRNALVARHAVRALELREGLDTTWATESRTESAERSGDATTAPGTPNGTESWAVRVAPLDEWLAVSRRQLAAVRAALAE